MNPITIFLVLILLSLFNSKLLGQGELITYISEPTLNEDQEEIVNRFEQSTRDVNIHFVEIENIASIEDSGRINVLLPDRETECTFYARKVTGDSSNYSWYGIIEGYNDSTDISFGTLSLIERNGQRFGYMNYDSMQYEFHYIGNGVTILVESNPDTLLCPIFEDDDLQDNIQSRTCPTLTNIDVLVVWTRKGAIDLSANNQYVPDLITNTISSGMEMANQAIFNSGITANTVRLNLVWSQEIEFTPTTASDSDLERIATSTTDQEAIAIRALREQYNADIVVIMLEERYGGIGGSVHINGLNGSDDYAYAVIHSVHALQNYVFVHEVAHLFGCRHQQSSIDPAIDPDDLPGPAHGYNFSHNGILGFGAIDYKTIMSVSIFRTSILNFSNPNVKFKNKRTGAVSTNNNVYQILNERCDVSAYRGGDYDPLIAGIDLHSTDCNNPNYRVLQAHTSNGGPTYSYTWYKSHNGFNYSSQIGNNITQSIQVPESGLFVKLVVTSGTESYEVVRFLYSCADSELFFVKTPMSGSLDEHNDIQISVFPNPTTGDNITIEINLISSSFGTLQLIDLEGKSQYHIKEGLFSKGQNSLSFDISKYPPKLYLVKFATNSQEYFAKILKL